MVECTHKAGICLRHVVNFRRHGRKECVRKGHINKTEVKRDWQPTLSHNEKRLPFCHIFLYVNMVVEVNGKKVLYANEKCFLMGT